VDNSQHVQVPDTDGAAHGGGAGFLRDQNPPMTLQDRASQAGVAQAPARIWRRVIYGFSVYNAYTGGPTWWSWCRPIRTCSINCRARRKSPYDPYYVCRVLEDARLLPDVHHRSGDGTTSMDTLRARAPRTQTC
jgi:hypothetical protein